MIRQASAPMTISMGSEAFSAGDDTVIYWLGSAGVFVNSHGTCIMIDPVLESDEKDHELSEAGYRYLVPPPIRAADIPRLDAVLYTHADTDHMAPVTARALLRLPVQYYGTECSCIRLQIDDGIPEGRTEVLDFNGETQIGSIRIRLTRCDHNWREMLPETEWKYGPHDCCGFYIYTEEGTVWIPGDSMLRPWHLEEEEPDLLFLDFSSDSYHFGTEDSIRLANHYRGSDLILYHYGTFLAPEHTAFNADPKWLEGRIDDPERIRMLAPGQPYVLRRKNR